MIIIAIAILVLIMTAILISMIIFFMVVRRAKTAAEQALIDGNEKQLNDAIIYFEKTSNIALLDGKIPSYLERVKKTLQCYQKLARTKDMMMARKDEYLEMAVRTARQELDKLDKTKYPKAYATLLVFYRLCLQKLATIKDPERQFAEAKRVLEDGLARFEHHQDKSILVTLWRQMIDLHISFGILEKDVAKLHAAREMADRLLGKVETQKDPAATYGYLVLSERVYESLAFFEDPASNLRKALEIVRGLNATVYTGENPQLKLGHEFSLFRIYQKLASAESNKNHLFKAREIITLIQNQIGRSDDPAASEIKVEKDEIDNVINGKTPIMTMDELYAVQKKRLEESSIE
jgi:tetratricopeptide (TPR) repeat protein